MGNQFCLVVHHSSSLDPNERSQWSQVVKIATQRLLCFSKNSKLTGFWHFGIWAWCYHFTDLKYWTVKMLDADHKEKLNMKFKALDRILVHWMWSSLAHLLMNRWTCINSPRVYESPALTHDFSHSYTDWINPQYSVHTAICVHFWMLSQWPYNLVPFTLVSLFPINLQHKVQLKSRNWNCPRSL